MTPNHLSHDLVREAPILAHDDTVEHGVREILRSELPALPVVGADGRLQGIFGEREFMSALFPGYVGQLGYAGFVKHALDDAIERRSACRHEHVGDYAYTEHVDVGEDYSDIQIVETFLHHRVLVIPVVTEGRIAGVITRGDFFGRIAERFLDAG
jgi:CBS domain-containing protein